MALSDQDDARPVGPAWIAGLAAAAMLALAVSVGLTALVQIHAAREATAQTAAAQRMLIAMLDQETGLRGYNLNGLREFLTPYRTGAEDFQVALATSRGSTAEDAAAQLMLDEQEQAAAEWRALAERAVREAEGRRTVYADAGRARQRKAVMDRFRLLNTDYQRLIDERRADRESSLAWLSAAVVLLMAALFGVVAVAIGRRQRRARRARAARAAAYAQRQHDLGVGLQVARSEDEAHDVLCRHLELSVPGGEAAILTRDGAEDRLVLATPVGDGSPVPERVAGQEPRACLAIRLAGRRHEDEEVASVLRCDVCGGTGGQADCSPLVVGGEVIGAALVRHPAPLTPQQDHAVEESVAQAAPVLANLRNLAAAQSRAATDGLTGLPNRRAFDETLHRMAAQAARTETPLTALALDLDRFKQINDTHGHDVGDEVLVATAELLRDVVRASDFCARVGGEEFVVLLPDTPRDGGAALAEKVRVAMHGLKVPGVARLTVSIGVATLPHDAATPGGLLRAADQLLYVAKESGRDRVEAGLDERVAAP